jgi:8-oxo-dGTP pyrophosphatase MutT (NUDIX family)
MHNSKIPLLRDAKANSDAGNYDRKAEILHAFMVMQPEEWAVDSDDGNHVVGVTHKRTNFKFHIPRAEVPPILFEGSHIPETEKSASIETDEVEIAADWVELLCEKNARKAVVITGNPDFISGNPAARKFYSELAELLKQRKYEVEFDAGKDHTTPDGGDVWIGHSRGADRLQYAPEGVETIALGAPGGLNHGRDKAALQNAIPGKSHFQLTRKMRAELLNSLGGSDVDRADEFLTPEIVKHAADQWDKLREELKPDPQMPIIPIPGLRNAMFVPKENFQQDQPIEGLSPDIHALAKAHGLIGYDPRPEFNNESVMRHEMGHSKMWDHDWAHKLRGAGQALSGWSQLLAMPLGALLHKRSPLLAPALTGGGTATGFIPTIAGEYHADAAGNTSTADPIIGNFRKTYWNAAGFNTALSAMMATAGRGTAKLVNALMHKVASARPVNVPSRDKLPFRESAEAILRDGDDLVGILAEGHGGKKFLKFPGGGIDEGESIHQGLEREMMEEAGVTGHSLTGHGHSQIVWHPDMEQHKPEKYAQFQGSRRHVFSGWLKSSGKPTSKEGDELTGSMRIPISKAVAHLQDQIAHPENDADGGMLRHRFLQLAAIHELMDSQHEKAAAVAKAIPTTGPEALAYHLSRVNLDDLEAQNHALVKSGKVSKRDQAVKILNIVEGMRRNELHPRELMINHVPVIPAAFRPYSLAGSSFIPGNANELYRDLFTNRKVYDEAKRELGPEGEGEAAHNLYNAVRAVYGFGEPVNDKARARGVTGFFEQITGSSPKFGYAQRRLLSKPVDNVGRATITINPDLGLDEIGIPREMAWDIFDTKLHRHLVRKGFSPADAALSLRDRDEHAKRALEDVVPNHPVQYSRAPAWHQFSTLGAMPKLFDGNTIQINPYVTAGLNADFDGDAINVHAPTSEEVLKETRDILMPSKMLFTIRDQDKVMPTIKHESLLSLHNAGARASVKVWNFPSHAEALAAVRKGTVPLHDSIVFPGSEEMEMKTQGLPPVVK